MSNIARRSTVVLAVSFVPGDPAGWRATVEGWARRCGFDGHRAYPVDESGRAEVFIDAPCEREAERIAALCRASPPAACEQVTVLGVFRRARMTPSA